MKDVASEEDKMGREQNRDIDFHINGYSFSGPIWLFKLYKCMNCINKILKQEKLLGSLQNSRSSVNSQKNQEGKHFSQTKTQNWVNNTLRSSAAGRAHYSAGRKETTQHLRSKHWIHVLPPSYLRCQISRSCKCTGLWIELDCLSLFLAHEAETRI